MDFIKIFELLLLASDKMKENKTLVKMYYWALVAVGLPAFLHALSSLIEAISKLSGQ